MNNEFTDVSYTEETAILFAEQGIDDTAAFDYEDDFSLMAA